MREGEGGGVRVGVTLGDGVGSMNCTATRQWLEWMMSSFFTVYPKLQAEVMKMVPDCALWPGLTSQDGSPDVPPQELLKWHEPSPLLPLLDT